MHSDNHSNLLRKFGVYQTFTEPHVPWQNRANPTIGEVKWYARKIMHTTETPDRLWCYCYEYLTDILSLFAKGRFDLQGRTPYEVVMCYTPNISKYVSFFWFQWCYYFDEQSRSKRLCRWLGPSHQVGQSFCFYLTSCISLKVVKRVFSLFWARSQKSTQKVTSHVHPSTSINATTINYKCNTTVTERINLIKTERTNVAGFEGQKN